MEYNNVSAGSSIDRASSSYALSGKVMLSSVLVLFAVVAFFLFFHSYARRTLRHRWSRRRRRRRRPGRILDSGPITTVPAVEGLFDQGLDVSILKSLPTFVYSNSGRGPVLECAVCLSEFEDNEKGRVLSECNHCFHNDCIDMWFHSHSNCPLCRAPVHLHVPSPAETVMPVLESAGMETAYAASPRCAADDDESETRPSSSSAPGTLTLLECPRTPLELVGMTVDIPAITAGGWRGSEELELEQGTTESQSSKLPGSRILSLKRIWSI